MRRFLFVLGSAVALAAFANPVDAQFKFGAHGAVLTGLDAVTISGTSTTIDRADAEYGLGGRVMFDPPLLPFAVVGSATYYFVDIDKYYTATLAGQLRIPLPIVKPYATAGLQTRRATGADAQNGLMAGLGVQLDFMLSLFLEATFEFNEDVTFGSESLDTNPLVIKGGILFGG